MGPTGSLWPKDALLGVEFDAKLDEIGTAIAVLRHCPDDRSTTRSNVVRRRCDESVRPELVYSTP